MVLLEFNTSQGSRSRLAGHCASFVSTALVLAILCTIVIRNSDARSPVPHVHSRHASLSLSSSSSSPSTLNGTSLFVLHNPHLRLAYNAFARPKIPGLYDDIEDVLTPIQGIDKFNQLVLGHSVHNESQHEHCREGDLQLAARNQSISLVQFYMASCPDCQGFSPYFKRLVADIGPLWRSLVKVFVVNCNDHQNLYLCQEQNPRIIVPTLRWYKWPFVQYDTRWREKSTNSVPGACTLGFKDNALSVQHRQFIEDERRDHIALRRATLKYILMSLDELAEKELSASGQTNTRLVERNRKLFLDSLPPVWHQLSLLDRRDTSDEALVDELNERMGRCLDHMNGPLTEDESVDNFVVVEPRGSYLGRTIIADWSQHTCNKRTNSSVHVLIHRSGDSSLHRYFRTILALGDDYKLLHFRLNCRKSLTKLTPLDEHTRPPGVHTKRSRRHATQRARLERIQQRATLERFYSSLGAQAARGIHVLPLKYAAAMTEAQGSSSRQLHKREILRDSQNRALLTFPELRNNSTANNSSAAESNLNWKPESVYPHAEEYRFAINQAIAKQLNFSEPVPGSLLNGSHPGELPKVAVNQQLPVVDAREDDLTMMYLTDYYKGLDELVNQDLRAKSELDGFQLLGATCFLHQLTRLFPWQGNAHGSQQIGQQSTARYYVRLLANQWTNELKSSLLSQNNFSTGSNQSLIRFLDLKLDDICHDMAGSSDTVSTLQSLSDRLGNVRVPSRKLEATLKKIQLETRIRLPPSDLLRWNYCAGSQPYLRAHTCSLWILFHTLTVHEYLNNEDRHRSRITSTDSSSVSERPEVYEFQIDYSKPPALACDPNRPEKALIETPSVRLFVNAADYVLADIINFVRFYLPCTHCAAHFSCMVSHSPGLHWTSDEIRPDSHLLWLWEGHNRVNMRTKNTHSEDPARPKHVFPSYKACPECYLEEPTDPLDFTSMRFDRAQLVQFIVSRYRKTSIINNKLNIELLGQ